MSTKTIKQRIKSVKNTSQITKAMEVVSATKMRKSQGFALSARPYAAASLEMLKNLLLRTHVLPPLLQSRKVEKLAFLVITSDKGLAGAFNSNVLKAAEKFITDPHNLRLITVGKKGRDYFERRGIFASKSFWGFGDYSTLQETLPVTEEVLQGFLRKEFDEVWAVYTNFRTTLLQQTILKKILPATREGIEEIIKGILPEKGKFSTATPIFNSLPLTPYSYEYKFEPSAAEILNELIPQLIRMHIHHIILESNASEHSARMVAMKSASDNAKELIGDLTLEYNKSRQAQITSELIEITGGQEALEL